MLPVTHLRKYFEGKRVLLVFIKKFLSSFYLSPANPVYLCKPMFLKHPVDISFLSHLWNFHTNFKPSRISLFVSKRKKKKKLCKLYFFVPVPLYFLSSLFPPPFLSCSMYTREKQSAQRWPIAAWNSFQG